MAGVLTKISNRLYKLFTRNASRSTENPGGPTPEAADQTWRDLEKDAKAADDELRRAARDKAIDDFLGTIGIKGLKANALKFINWVVVQVEKGFNWLMKPRSAGKKAMVTAGAVVVASAAATQFYRAAPQPEPAPTASPTQAEPVTLTINGVVIPTALPEVPDLPADVAMSDGEMGRAFDLLGVPTLEQMGRERLNLDVSDPPPLPPVITAAYAAPVAISAQQGTQVYTAASTVGQAYQALPEEARERFEREVDNSTYDDHHIELRNNFTVTSPIGSLTISTN